MPNGFENRPIPLEVQLDLKLQTFREVNRDFESAKGRARYLGGWLLQMSQEIAQLRYDIGTQQRDEQLEMMPGEYYAD